MTVAQLMDLLIVIFHGSQHRHAVEVALMWVYLGAYTRKAPQAGEGLPPAKLADRA